MTMTRDRTDMLNAKDRPSENYCSHCRHHLKEIAELKRALIEARDETSYQSRQYEDEISSKFESLPSYRQWMDARAKLEVTRGKYRLRNQSVKMMLEEVRQPKSNTTLRTPSSIKGDENEH